MPMRTDKNWRHGAVMLDVEHTRFALWAPDAQSVSVEFDDQPSAMMLSQTNGWFVLETYCPAGTLYRYKIDDDLEVPDPASRAQSGDVHSSSRVINHSTYPWKHPEWAGRPWHEAVIYELHVGVLGGFAEVEKLLPRLAGLGITAIELMPLAQFPGDRNWGYDGVLPYAPQSSYGTPDQLKALIDAAHGHGLMVILDVVYNHFGPDGNYLGNYAKGFFREDIKTPWGAAIDFRRREVRDFFIDNALMWLLDYRFDGLRLDAVHQIKDPTFLKEFAAQVRQRIDAPRVVWLNLENEHNAASLLEEGFDAQWNDDGHNALHVLLTDESDAYYADFANDPTQKLARCLSEGFVFQGEDNRHGHQRGEPSGHLPPSSFVLFLQNHDQIGNRAYGERLPLLTPGAALRTATVLLLLSPMIPLMFMGDDWAASEPFLFFTSHHGELAKAVREGRRSEFADFPAFSDEKTRESIPDPNARSTFEKSRPAFDVVFLETDQGTDHQQWLALYKQLLSLRHQYIMPRLVGAEPLEANVLGRGALIARWRMGDGSVLRMDLNLGERAVDVFPCERGTVLFETPPHAAELSRHGTLNPYTAIVSLTAIDVLEEQDEQ
ncbi:malto-oligosyltrehalose trehalohydrolase [Pseudomonas sp. 10B1]|uniref:malto-oligosyltrehalose trehalohydrolase n=1 Tax=unclassified Pseudomonas TaxID=196821 RepID=UPI002AB576F7|nr:MULTISPECIES: malto-oligosyltrehalose trehalohydrolase [unclassified Pseudomonas]MDY7560325.1 malto-oligosyltrehalose trehalohydrolase [Pseudomonas sp. AB6]MEA9975560.1 malto-oligosyltrehalose trehalohydrolase [Pseudomonas sp. RTS4]MEA9993955.1 malto-oligosyltrehalose trehalohydrolase [Pseudomonas sp. AA4]MEB0085365.1 malto-oligosyltrehalose trehalohydrolase [Pseudomonas sp. RTI1]MEB0124427.1 malto-oligosyltrehalose trehalohydrolase [Pseudomonas sp. CCC1.2]